MKTAHDIILKPVITENSMAGIADKKYTFKVATDATKVEIAQAVESCSPASRSLRSTPSPSVAASAVRVCMLVTPPLPRRQS